MNKLDHLNELLGAQPSHPPVHTWKPTQHGVIDIRIDAACIWHHEGQVIERDRLVRLFATILWCDSQGYALVTPVERLSIDVADVPFVVQQVQHEEGVWVAVTNVGDRVVIGTQNPVTMREYQGSWVPYILVRYALWARLNRRCYTQWIESAMPNYTEGKPMTLTSGDYVFEVAR